MKSSMIIAGACLLALILTIAECKLDLKAELVKRQDPSDCGDLTDTSSTLGRCVSIYTDYDSFCDGGCVAVFQEYNDCVGVSVDRALEQLEEACDDGITVSAISTVTAILVTVAAALN